MPTATINGIPVFNAVIDGDDTRMQKISLVDYPAVESDFQTFDRQKVAVKYVISDEDKRLVWGVVMRADFPIYRKSEDFGEYYMVFTPETIRTMAEKYLKEKLQNEVNTMHEEGSDVDDVDMVQFVIQDTARGIVPVGFEDIKDGSLFAEFHVNNDEVWEHIKDGTYKGFSLEGVFGLDPVEEGKETFSKNIKNNTMSKFKKVLALLSKAMVALGNVTTDGGILHWDGEEDLKVGDAVQIQAENGDLSAAADGDYKTDEGVIYRVKDGKVSEIVNSEDGGSGNDGNGGDGGEQPAVEAKASKFKKVMAAFSESYDEKKQKIYDAVRAVLPAMFSDYFYLWDCGDDYAVVEAMDENYNYRYFRFAIKWDGDNAVVDGEAVEGRIGFVPNEEAPATSTEEAPADNEELAKMTAQVAALMAKVEKLERTPAAKPASQEFESANKVGKTGNKHLDAIAEFVNAK